MGVLLRRFGPPAVAALTSSRTLAAQRWRREATRRLRGAPHEVHYFHQVDDPYGALVAQRLAAFVERWNVTLVPWLVGAPADEVMPERASAMSFALRDAATIAQHLNLSFVPSQQPPPEATVRANRILASAIARGRFAEAAKDVARALFVDPTSIGALEATYGATEADLARGDAKRKQLGHYYGATFFYGGEWYWGVDRLHYLEARLEALGLGDGGPTFELPPEGTRASGRRLRLEAFVSMRSPYSYLALPRVLSLSDRMPIDLALRPVLPMVMRGLPVPSVKRMYILKDAAREARRLAIPFGRVSDPLGAPIERLYALFPWARSRGRERDLLWSFGRAAWAEGIDTGADAGMRKVVERAGLTWADAEPHLREEGWRDEIEANRRALVAHDLWGVPSFALFDGDEVFTTWGQDRIGLLEAEIARRVEA